jgi:prolyl 4-hydroxylase
MIYLNDVESGGETAFVNVGLVLPPKAGMAVIWNNLYPDGTPNPDTLHQGMPVKAGHKAIITKWFRKPASP